MPTKILGNQITNFTIETTQLSNTAVTSLTVALPPKVLYANVANSTFTVLDDTAVNTGGGYIVVTGSNFVSGATVLVDTNTASAVTFVNSTTLQVQVPAKAAASYNLYVVNPDGGVGIRVNGINYSTDPSWVTSSPLSSQTSAIAFNVALSATGATSYALEAGSTLPSGTTLAANGYFSGTVTVGADTTYSFNVVATDSELQDATRTFQITVTVPALRLYSWGVNNTGQSGLNDRVNRSSPTQVGTDTNWDKISAGLSSTMAIKTNGTLWSWGSSLNGVLGQNDAVSRSSPTQVGALTNWSQISIGTRNGAAIKNDGTLWLWGQGFYGAQGQNDTAYRSSPTQVGTNTNWSQVNVAGQTAIIATKTDGTLWTWGANTEGELGLNDRVNRSSPTQVGTGTDWSKIFATGFSSSKLAAAIKTNGTLWVWGENQFGKLGLNDAFVNRSSPTQVGSGTDWNLVSINAYHGIATKTTGTLWSFGYNAKGMLGQNDRVNRSSPTQVGTATNWSKIDTGSYSCVATKTTGTLWTWGGSYSSHGHLGQNDAVDRSSPTQVGTNTNWNLVSSTQYNVTATTQG